MRASDAIPCDAAASIIRIGKELSTCDNEFCFVQELQLETYHDWVVAVKGSTKGFIFTTVLVDMNLLFARDVRRILCWHS